METRTRKGEKASELWKTLEAIRISLDLNEERFSKLLQMPKGKYKQFKNNDRIPSVMAITLLSRELGISLESIFEGKIPVKLRKP